MYLFYFCWTHLIVDALVPEVALCLLPPRGHHPGVVAAVAEEHRHLCLADAGEHGIKPELGGGGEQNRTERRRGAGSIGGLLPCERA
eukprot:8158851-Pyramimonas_sp.AAC.1